MLELQEHKEREDLMRLDQEEKVVMERRKTEKEKQQREEIERRQDREKISWIKAQQENKLR